MNVPSVATLNNYTHAQTFKNSVLGEKFVNIILKVNFIVIYAIPLTNSSRLCTDTLYIHCA